MAVFWTILLLSADAMPILQHLDVEKIGDSDRFEVEEKTSSWAMLGTHLLSGYRGRYFQRCQGLNATDGGEIIAVHGSCGADVDWVWLSARSLQQPCVVGTTLPVLHGRLLGNEHSVSQALGSQVEDNAQVEQHWPADPNLHVDEEDELRTCLSNWIDTTPQGLHLIMYGLYQRSIGTRRTTALVDIIDIQLQAAEAWIDILLQQGTTAVLHLVRPQEYIANQELHVVIEFYSRDVPRPVVDIPIVRKTIWYGVWEGNEPEAYYLTSGVTVPHALLQRGLREWCGPDLRTTCNLHVEKQIAVPHRPVLYRTGSIVEIYVHINEVENHDGGISLRQIQASRRSSIPHVNDRCCGLDGLCLAGHNDTLQLLQEDCSMLVSGPPSMTFRPNPQLQQRFDDIIPVAHQNREGQVVHQRIMPPPHWDSSPWYHSAVASGACHRRNDGQLVVHIRSWLVRHGGPREPHARDFAMRPQLLVRLPIAIRRVWHDRFQGRETITIRIVRPSPLADPDGSRKFHIIAELNRPVVTPLQPMLVALRQITSQGVGAPVWCVSLFPARFTSDDIRNECAQHCERHHLLIPLGGPLRRWMSPYNERQSTPGLFLPCWYDLRLQPVVAAYEVDEEAFHLMQRAVSRSPRRTGLVTPSSTDSGGTTVLAHVYHMASEHRLIVLDRSTTQTFAQQILGTWRCPPHVHLIDLHLVQSPPQDLEVSAHHTFIIELSIDRNRWATESDQLVLLDVFLEDRANVETQNHIRRVLWMRRMMCRQDVLHTVSASAICNQPEVQCVLKNNHIMWDIDEGAQRRIHHGDYVSLAISSPQTATDLLVSLTEQESADRQRYLYHPSPSSSSAPSGSQGEESPSGCSEDGISPSDEGQDRTAMDVQQLQVMAPYIGRQRWKLPHVVDLWCGASFLCTHGMVPNWVSNVTVVTSFDDLPPSGNGTPMVDLRKDFDALDDWTQHPWGECLFDAGGATKTDISCVHLPIPDLQQLAHELHESAPETVPVQVLRDHVHLFEEHLQSHVLTMQHGDHPQPEVLQIYTDGSYDGTKCGETHVGWGFAAFVGGPGGFRLEHMAYN